MSHDPLREAMQALPRQRASAAFTTRVMAQSRSVGRTNPLRRPAYAFALSIMLIITATSHLVLEHRREQYRQEMVAQQQELVQELAEIKALAAQSSGVVYLGGNDEVDLLLDLGTPAASGPQLVRASAVRQAAGTH